MEQMERSMGVSSFFMMDENFLLNRTARAAAARAHEGGGKSWSIYVFSSANAIQKYSMEELVELGVSWIWMGLESPNSTYTKLRNTDTQELTSKLRQHGIKLLGSTIVGLEHHTPENIAEEIEYAVSHGTDFHQFMLYTPVPGTPLFQQMEQEGRMLDGSIWPTFTGSSSSTSSTPRSRATSRRRLLDWAFRFDFERNGPSLFRICDTIFQGWKTYKNHPDLRVRERIAGESGQAAHDL